MVEYQMKKLSKQRKIDKKLKRTAPIVGIKKSNPFDLKFNRVKCKIFDNIAKSNAHDGAPGLSRKAAIEKRASTLMNELKQLGKTNKIIDRRYGQKDIKISEEDRQMKRFAAERVNLLKQNRFQVTDEVEELTHKGCALTAIEKYDRTMCDDDDYDDGSGEIASDIVSSAHFGGGVSNSSNPTPTDKRLKRKEIIAEMITRTKGVRYEKRVLRDEREEMTDKLDETWSRLMKRGVMNNFSETKVGKAVADQTKDDYDSLLLGLYSSRDKRGRASERVKTEQEISFEEKKKLESLEKQRLARMLSTSKSATGTGKDERSQKRFEVKYDDAGKLIDSQEIEKPHMLSIGYSDAEEVEHNDEPYEEDTFDLLLNESSNSDAETKNVPQTADDTVPFVFSIPDSYGIFKKYLEEKSSSKMELIFERMIKCYHPSLGEGNKKHLKRLFIYALRHFIDLSMQNNAVDMAKIDCICRNLYTLLKFDTYYAAHCVRAILRRQYALQIPRRKIFGFNTICLLRLVARLFPVTDIFHPVCTPALIFASKLLANVRIFSLKDAARVLILVATLLEYIVDSKRFVPEIVAFLYGLFLVAVENNTEERPPTVAFPISLRRMLVVEKQIEVDNPISSFSLDLNKVFSDSPTSFQDTDEHRCCILSSALAVLRSLFGIYSEHQSTFCIVFEPFARLIKILPMDKYPLKLRQILLETISELEIELNIKPSITQMQRSKAPKKLLELLEPRFDSEVESQRTTNKADGNSDRASLNRRYRKEVRSAIREIRKDSQFVARQKLSEQKENDRTRRQKTKALMHSLQVQESDYKKNQLTKSFD